MIDSFLLYLHTGITILSRNTAPFFFLPCFLCPCLLGLKVRRLVSCRPRLSPLADGPTVWARFEHRSAGERPFWPPDNSKDSIGAGSLATEEKELGVVSSRVSLADPAGARCAMDRYGALARAFFFLVLSVCLLTYVEEERCVRCDRSIVERRPRSLIKTIFRTSRRMWSV